ncbi:hypothetical protein [Ammoniphilus resinae]|uniref:Transmembrane protein n=1 Tax=Ammoniphilus resinae TaxID=861532 RepID=A0ABS4GMV4_9BACL|nr:hypothetical protein [Ammoniphilus resinae]MBP1931387.1 hypothetical protein [Ammoniphilus resinae]
MRLWIIRFLLVNIFIFSPFSWNCIPFPQPFATAAQDTPTVDNQKKGTETYRYRSGRRSFRPTPTPTPAPGYRAPTRTTPNYQTPPRRTGFFGGLGSFFAGAFLGSMLFSPFFGGGLGHFSFLGLIIDVLVLYLIFKLVRRLFRRT